MLWSQQHDEYRRQVSDATMIVSMNLQFPFWAAVNRKIFGWALQKALLQWEKRDDTTVYSKVFKTSMGIPCCHQIKELLVQGQSLKPRHFHAHWWIDRSLAPIPDDTRVILPPKTLRLRQAELEAQRQLAKSHKRGSGLTGNRRIPSSHELPLPSTLPPSTAPPVLIRPPRIEPSEYQRRRFPPLDDFQPHTPQIQPTHRNPKEEAGFYPPPPPPPPLQIQQSLQYPSQHAQIQPPLQYYPHDHQIHTPSQIQAPSSSLHPYYPPHQPQSQAPTSLDYAFRAATNALQDWF